MTVGTPFPTYEDLSAFLTELAVRHPHFVSVDAIGRSHRGREVWMATVTDRRAGPPEEKPGVYMDGNIHAEELTAGACRRSSLSEVCTTRISTGTASCSGCGSRTHRESGGSATATRA